jgi:hypothetical protein
MIRVRRGLRCDTESAQDGRGVRGAPTFEAADCPRLKLVECDFCRWRQDVEVQTVLVALLLELCLGELLAFVVEICAALGIDPGVVVADHGAVVVVLLLLC